MARRECDRMMGSKLLQKRYLNSTTAKTAAVPLPRLRNHKLLQEILPQQNQPIFWNCAIPLPRLDQPFLNATPCVKPAVSELVDYVR